MNCKYSVYKILTKLNIAWDIKKDIKNTRIFYVWDESRVPALDENGENMYEFYVVDYDADKREWIASFISIDGYVFSVIVNDITGDTVIKE